MTKPANSAPETASIVIKRALNADPSYTMALLLAGALHPGQPPAAARPSRTSAAKPRSAPARRARDEQLAAEYLHRAGFRVLDRNYRGAEGEIDIVAADCRTLVACQVKTRSSLRHGTPADASKLRRLRRLAINWVLTYGVTFDGLRVDVVEVLKSPDGEFTIEHARDVG